MLKRHRRYVLIFLAVFPFVAGPSCGPKYAVEYLQPYPPRGACEGGLEWEPPSPLPPSGVAHYRIERWDWTASSWGLEHVLGQVPAFQTYHLDRNWLGVGESVGYGVRAVDNNGIAHAVAPIVYSSPNCPTFPPEPERRVQVLLFNFTDFEPSTPFTINEVADRVFGQVGDYWSANSYGLQELVPAGGLGVNGYFGMPQPMSFYCNDQNSAGEGTQCAEGLLAQDAVDVADDVVDFSSVDWVLLVFSGVARVGRIVYPISNEGRLDAALLSAQNGLGERLYSGVAHEMGHLAGSGHGGLVFNCEGGRVFPPDPYDRNSGGCDTANGLYDQWDPMGGTNDATVHFSSFHKVKMGFMDPARIAIVEPEAGPVTVRLAALEDPDPSYGAFQMLKIPVAQGAVLFVEYREILGENVPNLVVRMRPALGAAGISSHDQLTPNEPFSFFEDPALGVRIQRVAQVNDWVDVLVSQP